MIWAKSAITAIAALLFLLADKRRKPLRPTEGELLELKGPPKNTASAGAKTVYTWDDVTVTVVGGKVVDSKARKSSVPENNPPY
jgi:hypothetical protein